MFTAAVNDSVQRNSWLKGCQGDNPMSAIDWPNPPRIRITLRAKPLCARDHKRAVFQPRPLHHPPHQVNGGHAQDKAQRGQAVSKQPSIPARRVLRMREYPADTPKHFRCQKTFASFNEWSNLCQTKGAMDTHTREIKGGNPSYLARRHAADPPNHLHRQTRATHPGQCRRHGDIAPAFNNTGEPPSHQASENVPV